MGVPFACVTAATHRCIASASARLDIVTDAIVKLTRVYVTSADSQSLSILGTSFPDRAPSHGPGLLYAQRENRLVIETSRLP